jgi:SAM-dependent methyltransferase
VTDPAHSSPAAAPDAVERARRAVAASPIWYHTLELAPGVVTPGRVDLRALAIKVLPDDLRGRRALDIGSFDGFWAFEMERRGAEVVAIDIEEIGDGQLPGNNRERLESNAASFDLDLARGFQLAAELLGSRVRRVICDVRELTPERIGGPVDIAFMGALLLHLRDPVGALERIHAALVPGGHLHQLEPLSLPLTLLHPRRPTASLQPLQTNFNWWYPNRAALRAYLRIAGFVDLRGRGIHKPPQKPPMRDYYYAVASQRPR